MNTDVAVALESMSRELGDTHKKLAVAAGSIAVLQRELAQAREEIARLTPPETTPPGDEAKPSKITDMPTKTKAA
jgi:hypothetical protein